MLGVEPTATTGEIKKAHKSLAQTYHPDKPDGDASKFMNVQQAYEVLKDADSRKRYDATGETEKPTTVDLVAVRLMELFAMLINEDKTGNFIAHAQNVIVNAIDGQQHTKIKVEQHKYKLTKRSGRVTVLEGDNLYQQLIDQDLSQCSQKIEDIETEIKLLNQVATRLQDYQDVTQAQPLTGRTWIA